MKVVHDEKVLSTLPVFAYLTNYEDMTDADIPLIVLDVAGCPDCSEFYGNLLVRNFMANVDNVYIDPSEVIPVKILKNGNGKVLAKMEGSDGSKITLLYNYNLKSLALVFNKKASEKLYNEAVELGKEYNVADSALFLEMFLNFANANIPSFQETMKDILLSETWVIDGDFDVLTSIDIKSMDFVISEEIPVETKANGKQLLRSLLIVYDVNPRTKEVDVRSDGMVVETISKDVRNVKAFAVVKSTEGMYIVVSEKFAKEIVKKYLPGLF